MTDTLIRDMDFGVVSRLEALAAESGVSVEDVARAALRAYVEPSQEAFLAIADRVAAMGPRFSGSSVALIGEDRDNDEPYR